MGTEYCAYQIALKTLKERCSYLQSKLESVEEENCQLKLQIPQDFMKKSPRSVQDVTQLQEEIILLTEQKAQLKHQIQLVTAENQKLWSRLSTFTSVDSTFGSNRNSHSCLEEHISYTENNSDVEVSKIVISPECNRESLEEISLKLNGIVLGVQGDSGRSGFRQIQKGEIQQGEIKSPFSNMINLKADNNSIQMETFAFSTSDDTGSILSSFKNHILKLKQLKQILLNNNNDLTSGITLFKNFQKNNLCSKTYSVNHGLDAVGHEQRENDFSTLQVHEIEIGNCEHVLNVGDKICPLCEVVFSGSFDEFSKHVNGHFSEEEIDVTASFELLQ